MKRTQAAGGRDYQGQAHCTGPLSTVLGSSKVGFEAKRGYNDVTYTGRPGHLLWPPLQPFGVGRRRKCPPWSS